MRFPVIVVFVAAHGCGGSSTPSDGGMDSAVEAGFDSGSEASDASDATSYVDAGCPWKSSLDFLSVCANVPPLCLSTNGTAMCGSNGMCTTGLPMMCNHPSDCAGDASCCAVTSSVSSTCPRDAIIDGSTSYAVMCSTSG